jgi:hypothetical protein
MPPPAARTATTTTGATQPGRPPPSLVSGASVVAATGDELSDDAVEPESVLAKGAGLVLAVPVRVGPVRVGLADVRALGEPAALDVVAAALVVGAALGEAGCVAGFWVCFVVGLLDDFAVGPTGPAGAGGVLALVATGAPGPGAAPGFLSAVVACQTSATESPTLSFRLSMPRVDELQAAPWLDQKIHQWSWVRPQHSCPAGGCGPAPSFASIWQTVSGPPSPPVMLNPAEVTALRATPALPHSWSTPPARFPKSTTTLTPAPGAHSAAVAGAVVAGRTPRVPAATKATGTSDRTIRRING